MTVDEQWKVMAIISCFYLINISQLYEVHCDNLGLVVHVE